MRQHANRTKTLAEKIDLQKQSEAALRKCLELDPSDARTYVSLGKLLVSQRRYEEARKVYEDGCAATGQNSINTSLQILHFEIFQRSSSPHGFSPCKDGLRHDLLQKIFPAKQSPTECHLVASYTKIPPSRLKPGHA